MQRCMNILDTVTCTCTAVTAVATYLIKKENLRSPQYRPGDADQLPRDDGALRSKA